ALEDALAIQDIRAELEGLAARLAVANLTAEDFLQLELLVERMRDAGERLAGDELVSLDLAFHELVNLRSKHRLLLELLDSVAVYVRGFVVHTRNYWATQASLAFVANSHQLLLDELRTRDPERADRAVHFHVETALASLIGHAPPAGGA
ncbi:MAG: GntR family transcriptional regulator, partial [Chloroflexi bacterium]|nr:GntR family transcriptional regulator [Chloroflexota bacterium]